MFKNLNALKHPMIVHMISKHLTEEEKIKLQQSKEKLKPFEFILGLNRKLGYFYDQVRKIMLTRNAA